MHGSTNLKHFIWGTKSYMFQHKGLIFREFINMQGAIFRKFIHNKMPATGSLLTWLTTSL
jgi:hypothetical protein